ncbi:putative disease resistance protein RGA3 [Argentina anserina]|uniref:putative disease resistance protein RGA3 n=1 Tax=Argentina anserina TaxID=57926 RepID=UPI0021765057|nr:putative disease resistance protein RGA3 [Potentilla anserina]
MEEALTLGSLVWDKKTIREWQDVLNSKIWELEEFEEQAFQPLLLSYYDLAPVVKRCLLYCAIFPKDYKLKKYRLIELWMSQNFVISNKNKNKRRIGQDCFESLAMRSFLQDFERDEFGDIVMCKMHDIVHDFVQFLTQKECKIVEGNEKMEVLGGKVRHLTLTSVPYGEFSFPASFYNCENVRTLTFFDSKLETISRDSMLQLKCLRTLRLGGNRWLKEVPKEIGGLIHLRYLDLSWSESLKEIPEAVCECINLQTLDLRKCMGLEKLPKAMGKLINLKHLCVWGCSRLRYLPKGIGSLKRLQSLNWFIICVGEDVEAMKLGDLGSMNQLQGSLWIRGLGEKDDDASEIEKAQLGKKEHLSRIGVDFQGGLQRKGESEIVKAIQPHPNLEYLGIWRCHILTAESLYWINSLHNLRRVSLYDWEFCEVLPPLGKLPSLESLEIQRMKKVKKVEVDFLAREEEEEVSETKILFSKLKRLSFAGLENWEEWEGITKVDSSEITIMPRLSELTILRCPKLKALPGFLYKIAALQTLTILDCDILAREYEKGVGKEWHNISHIQNLTIC